jgi:hypothetical protein
MSALLGTKDAPAVRSRGPRRRWVRWLAGVGGGLALATAAIGALHTPWGRPLLARLGGCPAMRVTGKEVDALRLRGLAAQLRPGAPAPARPALGFALDHDTPAAVRAWAAAAGVRCADKRRGLLAVHCANVPRSALPGAAGAVVAAAGPPATIEDLAFTFDPSSRLISVDAFTRRLAAGTATAGYASSSARLLGTLGVPTDQVGDDSAAALGLFGAARRRYRFSDYVAIVSLSRLSSGLALREQYLSGS